MTINGKYRIERVIGEGGMGVVTSATHLTLGTQVALKFLQSEMAAFPKIVERFLREAQASAHLRSDHACRVMDVSTLEDGVPFIVMELLHGRDLAQLLKASGPLAADLVATYILQACEAVGEAHVLGIVHRDLKPGNLFLTQRPDGTPLVKVLDFGIAKAPGGREFSLTQTAHVIGSPGYMSPEHLKSAKHAEPRSDIWSLGIVMYELLTGRQPFVAETITELALHIAMDPMPPLPHSVPRGIAAVVERCLEKDANRRFPDVAALGAALAPFAANGAVLANRIQRLQHHAAMPVTPAMAEASAAAPTTLRGATGEMLAPRRRSRGMLIGAIAGGTAIGIVSMVLVMRGGSPDTTTNNVEPAALPSPSTPTDDPPTTPSAEATDPPTDETADTTPGTSTTDKTATDEPPADKPADEPAADKPAADKPAADKPATDESTASDKPVVAKHPRPRPHVRPRARPRPHPTPSIEDIGASRK